MGFKEKPTINVDELIEPNEEVSKRRTFCITGPPGNGKTFSAGTIPSNEKGLFFDFDFKSAMLRNDDEIKKKLSFLDLYLMEDFSSNVDKIEQVKLALTEGNKWYGKFQWGFIDGLTNFHQMYKMQSHDEISGKKNIMNYEKMDYVEGKLWELLSRIIATIPNLVIYAHEDIRDMKDMSIKVFPLARKAISQAMPGRFQEIYRSTIIGDEEEIRYLWETKPTGDIYMSNSLIPGVPFRVPNNFDFLLSTDWNSVKTVDEAIENFEKKGGKITGWLLSK